jgi:predicted lipoprotein with Yx(FWY)xxD motif
MSMNSKVAGLAIVALVAAMTPFAADAAAAKKAIPDFSKQPLIEDYVAEPMPPGVQVIVTERDGPVFAEAKGHTLYNWPHRGLRIGAIGDYAGKSACTDERVTVTGGFMEPYPPGLTVPNAENRPTCMQVWPPFYADADAKPVGAWTVITRDDGKKQWAHRGQALYMSWLDHGPGDVLGASRAGPGGRSGGRDAVGPASNVPPVFTVASTIRGRMLRAEGRSIVYTWDKDGTNKSNCTGNCLNDWKPVLASALTESRGQFTVFDREPGIRQWAFRGKPLYTRAQLLGAPDLNDEGGDSPGWHDVYTQVVLPPPKEFTQQDTITGIVLADKHGKTLYVYSCQEDTQDQLACDYPDAVQDYRMAICGGGDPVRCQQQFPYVPAANNAKSESRLWSVMWVDPMSGRRASEGQQGAMSVWAFRERPVYTFNGDLEPGDIMGHQFGESEGTNNGYIAYFLRNVFFGRE